MFGLFKKASNPIKGLGSKIRSLIGKKISQENLEELEELLYQADLGSETVAKLIHSCEKRLSKNKALSIDACLEEIKNTLLEEISDPTPLNLKHSPHVILIVGINGSGKTTSIAKLANHFKKEGKSVLLAAADTFRAAAVEQLNMWAERLDVPIVKGKTGGDPAACVYDAMQAASSRKMDHLIIDTAGRLHTKTDLMGELQKIHSVCKKTDPSAPHEVWMVIDASIGQNAIEQAKLFTQYSKLTGLILTKWDGSAKGGACIPIQKKLGIPVRYIGTGESVEDLESFTKERFVEALLN